MHSLMITVMLACQSVVAIQPPTTTPSATIPEYLAYPKGYKPVEGGGFYLLPIWKPVSPDEFESYLRMIKVRAEQRPKLVSAYDEYRQADWAYRMKAVQPLFDRLAAIATRGWMRIMPVLVDDQVAVLRDSVEVAPQLTVAEARFFGDVGRMLDQSQQPVWTVIAGHRERDRLRASYSRFPAYALDRKSVV